MINRGVITIAYGKDKYIKMASYLGLSLKLTNPNLRTAVITDKQQHPNLLKYFDMIIPLNEEYGKSLYQKLRLIDYSPFEETLFIDSDCLVLNSLDALFQIYGVTSFGVTGGTYNSGFWWMDIQNVVEKFKLKHITKFNGGIYYFKKDEQASRIFSKALEIAEGYDKYGLKRFRDGGINEEPVFSISLALNNLGSTDDRGIGMYTPMKIKGNFEIDIIKGKCRYNKNGRIVNPTIIHFCFEYMNSFFYKREILKLRFIELGYHFSLIRIVELMLNTNYFLHVFIKRLYIMVRRRRRVSFKPLLPLLLP